MCSRRGYYAGSNGREQAQEWPGSGRGAELLAGAALPAAGVGRRAGRGAWPGPRLHGLEGLWGWRAVVLEEKMHGMWNGRSIALSWAVILEFRSSFLFYLGFFPHKWRGTEGLQA